MTSIVKCTAINSDFMFVGRAAQREIVHGLNFTIVNLMQRRIRERTRGALIAANPAPAIVENPDVDCMPRLEKSGDTLGECNEEDSNARGEELLKEENGFGPAPDPIVLAGQLKVIRDAFANNLAAYATVKRNSMDPNAGGYLNPYEVGESLEETMMKQLERPATVNRKRALGRAAKMNLNVEDLIRVQLRQQETQRSFLKANKVALVRQFHNLEAWRPDGQKYEGTLDDAEEIELLIPAIYRARMYVNADRGLFFERDRAIGLFVRGHPDGKGNLRLIDDCRTTIHRHFDGLMKHPEFYKQIDEAVQRGARWPTMIELPKANTSQQVHPRSI